MISLNDLKPDEQEWLLIACRIIVDAAFYDEQFVRLIAENKVVQAEARLRLLWIRYLVLNRKSCPSEIVVWYGRLAKQLLTTHERIRRRYRIVGE